MTTATETIAAKREYDTTERALHDRVRWFTEKWTSSADLNKREAAEFSADLIMVVQAVHRDAGRTTHELLVKALMAMPSPVFLTKKD